MGGGDSTPAPPDYQSQADAVIAEQNNQAKIDADKAAADKQAADFAALQQKEEDAKTAATARNQFNTQLHNDTLAANSYGSSHLAQLGLDPTNDYGLMADYTGMVDAARNSLGAQKSTITDASTIPDVEGSLNPDSMWSTALNDTLTGQRNKLNTTLNNTYSDDYANDAISDDFLNQYANTALQGQESDTRSALDRAHQSGTLTDAGYQYAIGQLGTAESQARGNIRTAGSGVIGNYRQAITDAINSARTSASNWNFGSNFDPNSVGKKISGLITADQSHAADDLTSALGTTSYFNPTDLIAKATAFQGDTAGGASIASTNNNNSAAGTSTGSSLSNAFADATANAQNASTQRRITANAGTY